MLMVEFDAPTTSTITSNPDGSTTTVREDPVPVFIHDVSSLFALAQSWDQCDAAKKASGEGTSTS
jgi:hypothetical protein